MIIPKFYESEQIKSIQFSIYNLISIIIQKYKLPIERSASSPDNFDADFGDVISHNRKLGGEVYDAISDDDKAVIYGSGFYGTFIAACLKDLSRIAYFIDQNPFLQGKSLLEIPIIPPDKLPDSVQNVYVGLNQAIAENVIDSVESWRNKSYNYLFL